MPRAKLTPYQKIMRAAARGAGCRLSAADVATLSIDHAIEAAAGWDDYREEIDCDNSWHEGEPLGRGRADTWPATCPSCGKDC